MIRKIIMLIWERLTKRKRWWEVSCRHVVWARSEADALIQVAGRPRHELDWRATKKYDDS